MAPEVTTLMAGSYKQQNELIGGGVAYAASAATAAVNTAAVTVADSGVASVASTANRTER